MVTLLTRGCLLYYIMLGSLTQIETILVSTTTFDFNMFGYGALIVAF